MATKTKLEMAIEKQAQKLPPAQYELLMSQYDTYKWNKARMKAIEDQLKLLDVNVPDDVKAQKLQLSKRRVLTSERSQLTNANNSIATKLNMWLRNTDDDTDEFDEFFKGR